MADGFFFIFYYSYDFKMYIPDWDLDPYKNTQPVDSPMLHEERTEVTKNEEIKFKH